MLDPSRLLGSSILSERLDRGSDHVTAARAALKAATHARTSASEWAADNCTRMRAFPCGTTGYEKAMT